MSKRFSLPTIYLLFFLFNSLSNIFAQNDNNIGLIKGKVIDRNSEEPLGNITVELVNSYPRKAGLTNSAGIFNMQTVPLGRHRLKVSGIGYQEKIVTDILVESGTYINLVITLDPETKINRSEINDIPSSEENQKKHQIVSVETTKDKPNNNMAGISARPFTVEDVTRYAGARFDPARMVTNFAGAAGYDDSRNDIIIRSNSPSFVLWQIEELPIENPNHIATIGTAGGTTPILNVFALGNCDFITGAFAAQYGNALSGVFDLKLRVGNQSTLAYMAQVGMQRAELLWEGPLNKKKMNGGSFILSLRSSTGRFFLQKLLPTDPEHQDFNLKIGSGSQKWGELEFFAIGGRSAMYMPYKMNTYPDAQTSLFLNPKSQAFYNKVKYDIFEYESYKHRNLMGLVGLKFTKKLSTQTYWRTIAGASQHNTFARWILNEEDSSGIVQNSVTTYSIDDIRNNYMLHSYINSKLSNKISLRGGLLGNFYDVRLKEIYQLDQSIDYDYDGLFLLAQAYIQTKLLLASNLTMVLGAHSQYLTLNNKITIEPRFALNWEFAKSHILNLGYGWHEQMVPYVSAFYQPQLTDGNGNSFFYTEHRKLNFMRSHHIGLAYNWLINADFRLKVEGYAQFLSRIPVDRDSSAFSEINFGAAFYDINYNVLESKGIGRNWGIELTLEKFFSAGYYGLLSASYSDSKYRGSDGLWYNSKFNYKYIANFLAGKEFLVGKQRRNILFTDIRFSTMGGKPYTPIDLEATFQRGDYSEVYIENETNARRLPAFYQLDFKLGFRLNKKSITHTFKMDLFNILNIQNPLTVRYSERFNPLGANVRGTEQIIYQRGFIPDITYTLQF